MNGVKQHSWHSPAVLSPLCAQCTDRPNIQLCISKGLHESFHNPVFFLGPPCDPSALMMFGPAVISRRRLRLAPRHPDHPSRPASRTNLSSGVHAHSLASVVIFSTSPARVQPAARPPVRSFIIFQIFCQMWTCNGRAAGR